MYRGIVHLQMGTLPAETVTIPALVLVFFHAAP